MIIFVALEVRRYLTGVSLLMWPSNTCSGLEMFLLLVSYNPDLLKELNFGAGRVSLGCLGDPLSHRDLNTGCLNSSYHVFLIGRAAARQGKGKSPSAGRENSTLLGVGRDEPSLGRRGLLYLHLTGGFVELCGFTSELDQVAGGGHSGD